MVNPDLLDLLRCPVCVKEDKGELEHFKESWLICHDCGRKYPIWEDIPVMLIEEGDKWQAAAKEDLPIPPPKPE